MQDFDYPERSKIREVRGDIRNEALVAEAMKGQAKIQAELVCLEQRGRGLVEKAERLLGYEPRYSNKDALVRNLEWYKAHQHEFARRSGVTHRVPWKQGAIGVLKALF